MSDIGIVFKDPENLDEARKLRDRWAIEVASLEKARDEAGREVERAKAKLAYLERYIELDSRKSSYR